MEKTYALILFALSLQTFHLSAEEAQSPNCIEHKRFIAGVKEQGLDLRISATTNDPVTAKEMHVELYETDDQGWKLIFRRVWSLACTIAEGDSELEIGVLDPSPFIPQEDKPSSCLPSDKLVNRLKKTGLFLVAQGSISETKGVLFFASFDTRKGPPHWYIAFENQGIACLYKRGNGWTPYKDKAVDTSLLDQLISSFPQ